MQSMLMRFQEDDIGRFATFRETYAPSVILQEIRGGSKGFASSKLQICMLTELYL